MAIQQGQDWEGNVYYWDDSTGERVSAPAPQAITPETATAAYQQVTNTAPPPGWAEQTVAAYSGDPTATIQNVIQDTATAALQNGTPVNIEYTPSAWTQGYAQPTGQTRVMPDYQGNPSIQVDANGNVVAWKGASGQTWTPQTYNAAVAKGQVDPRQVDIVPSRNPERTPFIQDLLKGVLFVAGGALTAGLGTELAGSIGTALGATGKTAETVGMAVLNAARSGVSGALSGQNPLIAALSSGINPFIGNGVNDLLQGAGLSTEVAKIASSAASGFTGATGGALASGQDLTSALSRGGLGALSSAISSGFQVTADDIAQALQDEQARQFMEEEVPMDSNISSAQDYAKALSALEKQLQGQFLDPQLAKLLGLSTSGTTASSALNVTPSTTRASGGGGVGGTSLPKAATAGPSSGGTSGTSSKGSSITLYPDTSGKGGVTTYGAGGVTTTASPGSQALSQALGVGSPSSATEDTGVSSPETGGTPQNVWNTASLRVKDATGSDY